MNHAAVNSNAIHPGLEANAAARDLIAAMPIVIFVKALRAAFGHRGQAGASLQAASR